ncbi:MAG: hypothetical protein U0J86_05300, partial [Collinsella sp.]|nr:hypothetical protein [Collinsella sp.]
AIVFPFVEYLGTDDSRRWPSLASYTTTVRATWFPAGAETAARSLDKMIHFPPSPTDQNEVAVE